MGRFNPERLESDVQWRSISRKLYCLERAWRRSSTRRAPYRWWMRRRHHQNEFCFYRRQMLPQVTLFPISICTALYMIDDRSEISLAVVPWTAGISEVYVHRGSHVSTASGTRSPQFNPAVLGRISLPQHIGHDIVLVKTTCWSRARDGSLQRENQSTRNSFLHKLFSKQVVGSFLMRSHPKFPGKVCPPAHWIPRYREESA